MEQEQDQEQTQAALYVAVDDGNKIVAMERSRRGDEGFRALLDEFTDYAANRGEIPSVLFFDIRTTDAALLPRIEAAEHSYLLDPSTATEKPGHPSRRNAERPSLLLQVRPRPSRGGQLQQHALDKGRLSAVPQRGAATGRP